MKLFFEDTMRQKIRKAIDGQLGGFPRLDRIVLTHSEWSHLMAEYEADDDCTNPSPGTRLVVMQGVNIERAKA